MKQFAYVGCRTTKERNARGKGISCYEIDNNKWTLKEIVNCIEENPSFLCFDEKKEFLYTIHGDKSSISSYKINLDGSLDYINSVSTAGLNPVHLIVDKTNKWIFVANLQSGSISIIPRNPDGSLKTVKEIYFISGKEINTISYPHQVFLDRSGNYLLVPCQARKEGKGQISVFKINHIKGILEKVYVSFTRENAEPRHLAFSPNNKFCYCVNEKDFSITFYKFDENTGVLTAEQILSTLPENYTEDGWASGIVLDPTNKFVVVSNRKHDSISSFKINEETGKLTYCDNIKTGGKQPRYIISNHITNSIWVANENSDTLTEFLLNENGYLKIIERNINTESPVCLIFK